MADALSRAGLPRSHWSLAMTPRVTGFHNGTLTHGLGFTMAEILLSLTIIGVVAAITLPSLTGNINERTWNTQRKALYARMSQAISLMPALSGYGVGATNAETASKTAEVFITNGLAKVLKMNNICDYNNVYDCGFSSSITTLENSKTALPMHLSQLNSGITFNAGHLNIIVADPVAFETANGESILTFYNPNCTSPDVLHTGNSDAGEQGYFISQQVCANFIFDLNGKRGPNTVGKDIGIMSVTYPSDSVVVMPVLPKSLDKEASYTEGSKLCREYDSEYRLPNVEELLSLYYNRLILFDWRYSSAWSSTSISKNEAWKLGYAAGMKYASAKDQENNILCVKRN